MLNKFKLGKWQDHVNVADFVKHNLTPYDGDQDFLLGPSEKTSLLWQKCLHLIHLEHKQKVLDIDVSTIPSIVAHGPGYIDKNNEVIVGLQTDAPLKRAIKPYGGIRVVEKACQEYDRTLDPQVSEIFRKYRKTHNDGVFDVYTDKMRLLRSRGLITGLPDNYARGRIIGDYRRVALYGVDRLIVAKQQDLKQLDGDMTDDLIRLREEISEQIRALIDMKVMAQKYGYDISQPAMNAQEAVQWTYFAYLAAIKEQDGAAMSLGNVSSFLDIFIEHDLQAGLIDEIKAQELIDQLVIKLRLVRHLRMNEYNELFSGDPTWVTESLGGLMHGGKSKVAKTTYRFLQTLYNLGPAPEPNLTVLWSEKLPENFKKFCAQVSIDTSSIQYENDDLMRHVCKSDDYGISCCVSLLKTGQMMQYFGARCNLAKILLLALNAGRDEMSGDLIVEGIEPMPDGPINYNEIQPRFKKALKQVLATYVNIMNIIHYMHDKYYYEKAQMALLNSQPERVMAFGVAGLSVTTDSLSAIKFAQVTTVRNEHGITQDFQVEGDYPRYGNDDDRVDAIAQELVRDFQTELEQHKIYRNARPTLSVLTITSNVVYGKKTGATPDGRSAGQPFAPGANPMHGRDDNGAIASLNSVAKLDYNYAQDGISNTFSIVPQALGSDRTSRIDNLVSLLTGYFKKGAHHLNVNVFDRDTLIKAMHEPENYPQLTIRVSGYAVHFVRLTPEQQKEVIARTFFEEF